MPRTAEDKLEKAKLARRERYAKIKSDPLKYAQEKEKERQRYLKRKQSKKILSIQDLTPKAKKLKRKKWRDNFRKYYQRKLLLKRGQELMDLNTPSASDTDDPLKIDVERAQQTTQNHNPTTVTEEINNDVNPIFLNLKKKIRQLEYLMQKKEKIYILKLQDLQRKLNNYRKICQRLKQRLESPSSKALRLIKDKKKENEVKKKVLFGEAIKKTLETNYQELKSKKDKKVFSDNILKEKYILKDHKVLSETKNFTVRNRKQELKENYYEKLKKDIVNFFERDDISRITAGRKECVSRDKIRKQRRYLLDSMKNLHKIFQAENTKVSYSYFCKQRPFWVLIPDVSDRETCLCKLHANIELLLRVLNVHKIIKEKDSREVINSLCCSNTPCLLNRCGSCKNKKIEYVLLDKDKEITFSRWEHKKESYITKGVEKEKRVITKVKITTTKTEAVEEFERMIPEFLKHEGTRRWQFTALKDLKCNLKKNEAIVHVDFSENYGFKYNSEVQSFHFGGSRKELTLHTSVIYLISSDNQTTSQSLCTISENMRHDAAAIWAHIVPLLDFIQFTNKNVNHLHFLSDSPSSQYRNKTMFYVISKLYWHFSNLKLITWNYSEAGHGKGAADGVGGTVKRIADAAVAKGKDIDNIDDFMTTVAQSTEKIKLDIVNDYQIFEKDLLIPFEKLKPLKGTIKVHQVLWQKDYPDLIFREMSCFVCLSADCYHVKFIGKLSCVENCEGVKGVRVWKNQEKINENVTDLHIESINDNILQQRCNNEGDFFIHKVKPKKTLLSKTLRTDCTQLRRHDKENIQIISNVVLRPVKDKNIVTRLSDLQPDNKLHLMPVPDINDMINLYNISNNDVNFSGVFENFVNASTFKEELSETERKLKCSLKSKTTRNNLNFSRNFDQNFIDPQIPSTSKLTAKLDVKTDIEKPPVHRIYDPSSSDDDYEIFPPTKKKYFQ